MNLYLGSLAKSIEALRRSIQVAGRLDTSDPDLQATVRVGVIQNFKVAYEVSWKLMKRWLEANIGTVYVDGVTRRELFRFAAENRLIADVDRWMVYHDARNQSSHMYNEETAQNVFSEATAFFHDAEQLLKTLETRNA